MTAIAIQERIFIYILADSMVHWNSDGRSIEWRGRMNDTIRTTRVLLMRGQSDREPWPISRSKSNAYASYLKASGGEIQSKPSSCSRFLKQTISM